MNTSTLPISLLFAVSALYTVYFLFRASRNSKPFLLVLLILGLIQGVLGARGFFNDFDSIPPRFVFLVLPSLIGIILLLSLTKGRQFLDRLDSKALNFIHLVRIPVEIGLHLLYLELLIPKIMTYEGMNFDILSGISALFILWFYYIKKRLSPAIVFVWNIICLALLVNIVTLAIGAAPSPFQAWSFDVPNTGVVKFPVVWLPGIIVPAVLLTHLVEIRKFLLGRMRNT